MRTDGGVVCWGSVGNEDRRTDVPAGRFSTVTVGGDHACGVRTDGSAVCWGDNEFGQAVAPAGSFSTVAAGWSHACGVRTDGGVVCWGDDEFGQAVAPVGSFSTVAAGGAHTCGVRTDGAVVCWGYDDFGQAAPPGGRFSAVAAGWEYSCGVRTDGSVACWGRNERAEAEPPGGRFSTVAPDWGHHWCAVRASGGVACWGDNEFGQTDAPAGRFSAVTVGVSHSCGVRADGGVACWGDSWLGKTEAPEGRFSAVAAGAWHSCGVRTGGTLTCWGENSRSQTETPAGRFSTVAAGLRYSCGVRADGGIACWGDNEFGQADAPEGRFSAVAAGMRHSCGLRADGSVACWGDNEFGQAVVPEGSFTRIAAGGWHSCGLRAGGDVVCWGYNHVGQAEAPEGSFSTVAAGRINSCGVRSDAGISCWGSGALRTASGGEDPLAPTAVEVTAADNPLTPPRNLRIRGSGDGGFTVTWSRPISSRDAEAPELQGYTVLISPPSLPGVGQRAASVAAAALAPDDESSDGPQAPPADAPHETRSLSPEQREFGFRGRLGETYTVIVTADYPTGTSPPVTGRITAEYSPGPPRNLELRRLDASSFRITWDPPADEGTSTVEGYVLIHGYELDIEATGPVMGPLFGAVDRSDCLAHEEIISTRARCHVTAERRALTVRGLPGERFSVEVSALPEGDLGTSFGSSFPAATREITLPCPAGPRFDVESRLSTPGVLVLSRHVTARTPFWTAASWEDRPFSLDRPDLGYRNSRSAWVDSRRVAAGSEGGSVDRTSNLAPGGCSWVFEGARVKGDAVVSGNAVVADEATVRDDAVVSGNAFIGGEATVRDDAVVSGNAVVAGEATVRDDARVSGNAFIGGEATVEDDATVCGEADVVGKARVSGYAEVCGEAVLFGDLEAHCETRGAADCRFDGEAEFERLDRELRRELRRQLREELRSCWDHDDLIEPMLDRMLDPDSKAGEEWSWLDQEMLSDCRFLRRLRELGDTLSARGPWGLMATFSIGLLQTLRLSTFAASAVRALEGLEELQEAQNAKSALMRLREQ